MANKDLHYTSKRIYLAEEDVEIHKQGECVVDESNDGKPYLVYMTAGANKFLRIYSARVKECIAALESKENSENTES